MRTCEEYEEALWEAAETDCVPPALREHCAACTPCREALGDLQQAMRGFTALKTLETLAPRPELSRYLPGPSRRWPWGWGLAATCCLVLIVISILFWHGAPANNVPVVKNPVPAAPLLPTARQQTPARVVQATVRQMKAPALKQQRRLVELHTTTHHRWTRKRHQPMPAVILAKMPARTAPEIVPILGPVASLPPSAIPVESDRILLLIEEPAVCNEVYQAMETVGHAGTPECPVIYARSPGG